MNLAPTPSWDDVWQWDTVTPLLGGPSDTPLNRQAQALTNRTALLKSRTDTMVLPFATQLDAVNALAGLSEDQPIKIEADETRDGRSTLNVKQGGALTFVRYAETALSGNALDAVASWPDVPEIAATPDAQKSASNAQAKALLNRTEMLRNATRGSYALKGGAANDAESAIITHTKNSYCTYDLITIKHSRWQTLRKVYPDGATTGNGATTPAGATPMAIAKSKGLRVVINADGGRTVSGGLRPIGLQIADGELYLDWLPGETFPEAIVMMDDGTLVEATATDGITGAQWVAAGARWSAGFGWTCVRDGVAINLDSKPAPFDGATVSARTVIGQKYDGTILIALVEGRTGSYGITGTKCGELMVSLGCRIAHILDGGGSTQCWWSDCYAMPSSDSLFASERAVPAFLTIDLPVSQYDSGWKYINQASGITANGAGFAPIAIRQRGPNIQIGINAVGTFAADTAVKLSEGAIPDRYTPPNAALMRLPVSGGSGYGGSVYYASGALYVRAGTQALAYCAGNSQWPAKHAGLPAVL